jgi:hypothetical protein
MEMSAGAVSRNARAGETAGALTANAYNRFEAKQSAKKKWHAGPSGLWGSHQGDDERKQAAQAARELIIGGEQFASFALGEGEIDAIVDGSLRDERHLDGSNQQKRRRVKSWRRAEHIVGR